jgi:sec-independent protein translocase protein TatA
MFAFIPFVGSPGLPELMIFAVIILLVFGKRLPSVMRSLGRSVVEFKQGTKDAEENTDAPTDDA